MVVVMRANLSGSRMHLNGCKDLYTYGKEGMMAEVTIQALKNGPLLVKGSVELTDAKGQPFQVQTAGQPVALCRCGHSANKPFCDGSHQKAGFEG